MRAGVIDLLRLGGRMAGTLVRRGDGGDGASVACAWARELLERETGSTALEIGVPTRSILLIGRGDRSTRILEIPPVDGDVSTGSTKKGAMSFLAPRALTITDGDDWARLRRFNERVLASGRPHPFADAFLQVVRSAFADSVRSSEEVRAAMGRAMVGIVLGEVEAGDDPAADAARLFDVVQSPLRRTALGLLYTRRRQRLFALLERVLDESGDGRRTLVALARAEAGHVSRRELLDQVPHWMFTFTGSGTDLLVRTLALVTARQVVLRRVRGELDAAGSLDDPAAIARLPYLEACLREAGRLFPPVTKTFHRVGGVETVHYFPLLQRDPTLGPSVHAFRPERWLKPDPDPPARASNLFLRGPRACPGEELILFVCKAALARQLGELEEPGPSDEVREGHRRRGPADLGALGELRPDQPSRLARDPLPVSFPERDARFTSKGGAR